MKGSAYMTCNMCPRQCSKDRNTSVGFCGVGNIFRVARIAPHAWEEPPVSGERGSGTVFFSGCNLRCVFCQNKEISHSPKGKEYSADELYAAILDMVERQGVHNVNFVTPSHYLIQLLPVLERLKATCDLPVVWNSSGYESVESLRMLNGLVDVYLPDFKYASSQLAGKYSRAEDYPTVALAAIKEMYRQTGAVRFSPDGLIEKGVIVRHLVLPGERQDSVAVLRILSENLAIRDIRLSLMSQYTPDFAMDCEFKNLHRRVTTFEYNFVLDEAIRLGFDGYFQDKSSAVKNYTPEF